MSDTKITAQVLYWVWNPQKGSPTKHYFTYMDAEAQANYLANLYPGQTFIILQAISAVCVATTLKIQYDRTHKQAQYIKYRSFSEDAKPIPPTDTY